MAGRRHDERPPAKGADPFHEPTTFALPPRGAASGWSLRVLGDGVAGVYPLPEGGALTLGRGADCPVRINHSSVSRQHAVVRLERGRITVEDLGSRNGCRIGERALPAHEACAWEPGELLEIGSIFAVIQPGEAERGDDERRARVAAAVSGRCTLVHVAFSAALPAVTLEALVSEALGGAPAASFQPGSCDAVLRSSDAGDAGAARTVANRLLAHGVQVQVAIAGAPEDGADLAQLRVAALRRLPAPDGEGAMRRVTQVAERIAPSDISVLIVGETGVGKEVMAELIHRRSRRADRPLLRLNCGAFAEALLDSELFGHEKGAFTSAEQAKPGLLESAEGGTVLLDEIGELPLVLQVKLLRVLEERQVRRVGGLKARPLDLRFLFATNRDLEADCAAGRFRRDLYFRLNGITLAVPPLRQRRSEILPLATRFLEAAAGEGRPPRLSDEVRVWVEAYDWPGNIRELKNVITRATVLAGGGEIRREHLAIDAAAAPLPPVAAAADDPQRQRIIDALTQFAGNQTRAAKSLGVSRQTLVAWLDKHGIPRPRKA